MSNRAANPLLRIVTSSGAVAGTGFLLRGLDDRAYAITCAHVVNTAIGRGGEEKSPPPPGTLVSLSGLSRPASLLAWIPPVGVGQAKDDPVADIAVLDPNIPAERGWPVLRVEPPDQVVAGGDVPFDGSGFKGTADGLPVRGMLRSVDFGGWFVAHATEGFGSFIEPGLSGAALMDARRRVLGMVVQRHGPAGGFEGLVVPAMAIARAWPPLSSAYVGLDSFTARTAHLFFGRERQVTDLRARLESQPIVAVVGGSGSGKSSLVRAGLVPLLESERWRAVVFEPQQYPMAQWAEAIARVLSPQAGFAEIAAEADLWRRRLDEGQVEPILEALGVGKEGVLVVIDQFEQFFTADSDKQENVAEQLVKILRMLRNAVRRDDVRLVLTVRKDFLSRIEAADQDADRLLRDPTPPYMLGAMSIDEVRRAVVEAASVFGVTVDPGLAATVAADAAGGDGRLPLLQVALRRMWPGLRRTEAGWMLGGSGLPAASLSESLRKAADEVIAGLEAGRRGDAVPPGTVDRVLQSLVSWTVTDHLVSRRAISLLPNADQAELADWEVVRQLASGRLVRLGEANGRPTAELAHDRLIVDWPRLAELIEVNRAFMDWLVPLRDYREPLWREGGFTRDRLLSGADVPVAEKWVASRRTDVPKGVRDLIAASAQEEARSRKQLEDALRAANNRLTAVGAVLAVALLVTGIAYGGFREAEAERNQALLAQSHLLAAESTRALAETFSLRAYLLAAQGVDWPDVSVRPEAAEARAALLVASAALVGKDIPSSSKLHFTPSNGTVPLVAVAVTSSGQVQHVTIDPADGTAKRVNLLTVGKPPPFLAVSPDGSRVLLKGRDAAGTPGARLIEGSTVGEWRNLEPDFFGQWLSPEIGAVYTCDRQGLWHLDLASGARRLLPVPDCGGEDPSMAEQWLVGQWLVGRSLLPGAPLTLWTLLPNAAPSQVIGDDRDRVLDVQADGNLVSVLIYSTTGAVRVWSSDPVRRRVVLEGEVQADLLGRLSTDGRHAVLLNQYQGNIRVSGPDGPIREFAAPRSYAPLPETRIPTWDLGISRDGQRLWLTDGTGAIVVDLATGSQTPAIWTAEQDKVFMDHVGEWLISPRFDEVVVWRIDQLLDQRHLVEAAEQVVRREIAAGREHCLSRADLARLDLVEPAGETPALREGRTHACPLASDFPQARTGYFDRFWRDMFRVVSGRSL